MKNFYKIFLCLTLAFVSCFAFVGCGDKNNNLNTEEWETTVISSNNCSEYLDLSAYLYYVCANKDFYFTNMPCVDNCAYKGNIDNQYLNSDRTAEDSYKRNLNYFFNTPKDSENMRWKILEFTAKKDIRLKCLEFDLAREEGVIINTYNISFCIKTNEDTRTYNTDTSENKDNHCKFTFRPFWFPEYDDIQENSYIYIPTGAKLCLIFNDIKLIKDTYSKEQSEINGSDSPEYSTDEERAFAKTQSMKCFNMGNFVLSCETK